MAGYREPLGIGIVGLGMVASAHAKALLELKGQVEVRGVHARDAAKTRAFAECYGFPVATSLEAMLADPAIGAILLLTPPNARLEIIEACARAGKHVLTEKPLERSGEAAARLVDICETAGVTLGVVFQHRFRKASLAFKSLSETGELGAVAMVQATIPWWRPQSYYDQPGRGTYTRDGGGVLISQAIHTLDLMLSVLGPVEQVAAVAGTTRMHRMEAEDFVGAGLRFANGAMGVLTATTAAFPGGPESLVVTYEKGSVRLQGGVLAVTGMDGQTSQIGEEAGTGGGADPMAFPHDWHRDLIADFADAVRDGRAPVVSGREALKVHRLIDALTVSGREGRAVTIA